MEKQLRRFDGITKFSQLERLQVKFRENLIDRDAMMNGNEIQDSLEGADFERSVVGNGNVMFPVELGRQADVRTVLPDALVVKRL
jgi:hypothetical protein